jgi:DNA mismatch repair protein MutS
VAQLAGIPKSVVAAAKRKLAQLEQSNVASASSQSELFSSAEPAAELLVHPALSALEALQADDLTPKQALDALYQLKELMNE